MSDAPQPPPARPDAARVRPRPGGHWLAIAVAVVAAFSVWSWWDHRSELGAAREELAQRLRASDTDARDARTLAKEAQEAVRDAQAKIGAVEAKIAESASQQIALESMYQELARSRDDWVLAEVEQTLIIASQQLALAGNVQAALTGLQTADARLARSDRPQFIALRKVIGRDIERLKTAPNLDVAGLTLRIDQVITTVDALPLLAEARPSGEPARPPPPAQSGWWARAGEAIWSEVRSLVRVQRLDAAAEPALLAPEQAYFVRENLKLRLLHARLALLQRNETAFKGDLKTASAWVTRYFDTRQKGVQAALATFSQLNAAAVNVELPSIAESLAAVRNFKATRGGPGGK